MDDPAGGLGPLLEAGLGKARRIAVIGIGDELSPVDCLGMAAARHLAADCPPRTRVFFAGTVPESITGPVRRCRPDHILLLDAADMGLPPGSMAVVAKGDIRAGLFSTHALPLDVVMEYLARETGARVTLLGIQPDLERPDHRLAGAAEERYVTGLAVLFGLLRYTIDRPRRDTPV